MFPLLNTVQDPRENSSLFGIETQYEQKFLHRLVEERIENGGVANVTALIYEDDGISKRLTKYSVFNQNANRIAQVILDTVKMESLKPNLDGDWIVAVCMTNSDNLITTLLAIWKAGASYLPIDVSFPENRVDHIIKEAKPILVIHDDSYPNVNFFSPVKSMKFGELKRFSHRMKSENIPDEEMLTKGDPTTKAITLYTSGSTGSPKGVRLRHFTFIHRIMWQLNTYPFGPNEKHSVFKTPFIFVDHVCELWCPIISGKSVIVIPHSVLVNPENFVAILENYQVGRLLGVPTLLRTLLMYLNMLESNQTKFMLSNLKIWFSSGEPLSVQLAKEFFDYFDYGKHVLVNSYGCTEISCDVVSYELKSKSQLESMEKIPLGSPLPNTAMYILDNDNKISPEEEIGEICCAGVMITTDGYINGRSPDAFPRNTVDSNPLYSKMYKTGDYGFIKNGLLYYEGRRDTQIKIRGQRVDISEVEKNVNELSYISSSAILVYHATQIDQALVAFVVTKNAIAKTPFEVEHDLKSRLAPFMIPQVLIIEEFPYVPSGKIDRQALLKMYEETAGKKRAKSDFKNVRRESLNVAKQVFEIIGQVLGTQLRGEITAKSNFFELGGDSMNTVTTVMKLRERGFYIGLTDFIKARTLDEVLNKLKTRKPRVSSMRMSVTGMPLELEPINEVEKDACVDLIAKCFFHKADIDQFLVGLKLEHYKEILDSFWSKLVEQGLSFMAKTEEGEIVGVDLNFDIVDEPEVIAKNDNVLMTTFEFLESVEKPIIKSRLNPEKGEVMECFMQATTLNLSAQDKIGIMRIMEAEGIRMAREKGFKGVFSTNSNPLTQQFGQSIFGYETLCEVSINTFVDKLGNQPFKNAPDHYKAICMYKSLE